jgi:hypothetical protein
MAIMTPVENLGRYYHGYWYLASPYTHGDPEVVLNRYFAARRAMAHLMKRGLFVVSPIVIGHAAAEEVDLPTDYEFWWDFNACLMLRSCGMIILRLDGWQHSRGISAEQGFYIHNGKPIFAIDDGQAADAETIFAPGHAASLL